MAARTNPARPGICHGILAGLYTESIDLLAWIQYREPMKRWLPKLSRDSEAPLYRQLVEAIARDIRSGRLEAGTRLPPHRELAHALAVSVGAVTRAYDEAADRGLVTGHVGRGTFVAARPRPQNGPIDLSRTTVPVDASGAVAEGIMALRRRPVLLERLTCELTGGPDRDRHAAAAWLERTAGFGNLEWTRLICCLGAQNAMAIALAALAEPGRPILCEASTFSGMKALAALTGRPLLGVEMDAEGATPDGLERAARNGGARLFYTIPTLQNPTTSVMGLARREAIVHVARKCDLWLIEDDIYAPYARGYGLPPLALLAPERTIYISSLSKIVAPGLRAGFLVAPDGDAFDRCQRAARALMHSPPGLTGAIATHLIESGSADTVADDAVAEAGRRIACARRVLGSAVAVTSVDAGLHAWVPMREIEAERAVAHALHLGIRLSSPSAFGTSADLQATGLRLCLGGAASVAVLESALVRLRGIIRGELPDPDQDRF